MDEKRKFDNLHHSLAGTGANTDFSAGLNYVICVDELKDADIKGRLYCGCLPQGKGFSCSEELIICIDDIMDKIDFPQSTLDKKSFVKKKGTVVKLSEKEITEVMEKMKNFNTDSAAGDRATFVLQVQFRQNASWQGVVKSVETDETHSFKSALELVKIIDEISAGKVAGGSNGLISPEAITGNSEDEEK
ncbi:MAG: hypothetical protein K6F52_00855 [Clostridia bacterium]|nr:hypothetical protein [Clostridia bacterium]